MSLTTFLRRKRLERNEHYRALVDQVEQKVRPVEPELALVEHLADPRGTFLDVGANRGYYSVVALGGFARVVAVEAHPDLAAGLRRTFGSAVEVVEKALSDEAGTTTMWIPTSNGRDVDFRGSLQEDANPGFDQRRIDVATTRVDDLGLRRPALLKVDVEGHELAVLHGAERTLRQERPALVVESEERHNVGGVEAVHDFLLGCGYRGAFVHRGVVRPLEEFRLEEHQGQGNAKAVGAPKSEDYVNNFVFVPVESDVRLPATVA